MRIIFVRHGHPNYELDCLTPLGHKHGDAVAERLKGEPIEKIFSSTCGRALETAEHIDKNFGLGVEGLEFMREIKWGSADGSPVYEDGHPWMNSDYLVEQGKDLLDKDWRVSEQYRNNKAVVSGDTLGEKLDEWLVTLATDCRRIPRNVGKTCAPWCKKQESTAFRRKPLWRTDLL